MSSSEPNTKDIFAEASRLTDPAERAAYLDRVCAGNPERRRDVESLLAANDKAGDFLKRTIQLPEPDVALEHAGTRIGRYKLLEQIGEGGFGVVWMAEQEEPVRRRVALKIIKLGMDTKEVVARFEAERQALALMDHPNIASVFDGGATDTGRPYFVMELVKGIPITRFCDERKLTTEERLELFMQVCHAVQHAHQKGIIHRDLKPSNILVTVRDDRPVPKVIDFGVAKATQARLTQKTLFTRLQQWIGTPAYMSPEQAGLGSLDVDTRSDIYSLGVLLYELLTGRTPFDTEKLLATGYEAVMRTIREEEPPKPSTRISTLAEEELRAVAARRGAEPAKLGRLVRGDLDWIVMKALEKDRARRYDTANSFAEDLRRHLNREAVTAFPPSPLYRTRRFLVRHKVAAGFTVTLVLVLAAGTVVSLSQARRAGRSASEAERLRQVATNETARALHALNHAQAGAYADRVVLASQRIEAGDLSQADELLEACPEALRQWEWHYLKRQCQPACCVLGGHSNEVSSLAASLDGRWLASLEKGGRLLLWDLKGDLSKPAQTWQAMDSSHDDLPPRNKGLAFSHDSRTLAYARGRDPGGSVLGLVSIGSTSGSRQLVWTNESSFQSLCLSFSADDRSVMLGCSDGLLRSYDVTNGRQVTNYLIFPAAFSRDGSRVVSLGVARLAWQGRREPARALKIFDTSSGQELVAITNLSEPPILFSAALSRDGKRVAAGFAEVSAQHPDHSSAIVQAERGTVVVWELSTGKEILRYRLARAAPMDLEFSTDGRQLAIASAGCSYVVIGTAVGEIFVGSCSWHIPNPGSVSIFDVTSCEEIVSLRGHKQDVTSIAFTDGSHRLASSSSDGTVRVWDLGMRRVIPLGGRWTKEPNDPKFYPQSLSPLGWDGRVIAVSRPGTTWDAIDLATGKAVGSVRIPEENRIHDAALTRSPCGLICLSDTALYYRDLAAEGKSWSLSTADLGLGAERLAVSPDGRRVALAPGRTDQEAVDMLMLEASTGKLIMRTNLPGIGGIAFSPDSRFLVAGDMDGNVRVWGATSGREVLRQCVSEPRLGTATFAASFDESVRFMRIPGTHIPETRVAVSPDRRPYGVDLANNKIFMDNLFVGGSEFASLLAQADFSPLAFWRMRRTGIPVTAVAVSPAGSHLATAAGAMSVELRLWDIQTKRLIWVAPLASVGVAIAFSPSGSRLAVASMSPPGTGAELVIFDTNSGKELVHLPSKTAVESLAFSPDGARLWGVTKGGMLVFWDATPWPEPITPPGVALRASAVENAERESNTGP